VAYCSRSGRKKASPEYIDAASRFQARSSTRIQTGIIFYDILNAAVSYTNVAGRRLARDKNFMWKKTDRMEMNAFVDLHVLAGALKAHHRCVRELYDLRDGAPLFRAAMSEKKV
jgi:hypothetical protein